VSEAAKYYRKVIKTRLEIEILRQILRRMRTFFVTFRKAAAKKGKNAFL